MPAELKSICQFDFRRFYEEYFWNLAKKPMQQHHVEAFNRIETAVMSVVPDIQTVNMPKGEGKTFFRPGCRTLGGAVRAPQEYRHLPRQPPGS